MAVASSAVPVLDAAITHEKRSSVADKLVAKGISSEIRVVSPDEYKEAAACLAEAFREDHVVRYAIDTPDRMHLSEVERFEQHKLALEYVTYAHCLKGLVITTGENYACVALWMPPGKNIDDWLTIIRSGMWRLKFQLSAEGKERFFDEFLPLLHETKQEILGERDEHSWYLNYIGTKPEARGKGYARKLIEYVTKQVSFVFHSTLCISDRIPQADEEERACYLESSHDINLKIYGKLGFDLKKQIYLSRGNEPIRMDVMVREPGKLRSEK